VARIIELAKVYGRYGYRRITALLRREGWKVNHKRVERIWRREGLKVPRRQPKRGRLWLNDGSCIRKRAKGANHVWSYDFVFDRTQDGRPLRMLTLVDEFTRECLAIDVERKLGSEDVIDRLAQLFVRRGTPAYLRSDNGAEFTAHAVREWLGWLGVGTLYIEPGSPWENGYVESFNGKLRDELLDGEIFLDFPQFRRLRSGVSTKPGQARLHAAGGEDTDRALEAAVQPIPPPQRPGIPASGTRSDRNQATGNESAPTGGSSSTNIGSGLPRGAGQTRLCASHRSKRSRPFLRW
jgi:transposase InsO family protein